MVLVLLLGDALLIAADTKREGDDAAQFIPEWIELSKICQDTHTFLFEPGHRMFELIDLVGVWLWDILLEVGLDLTRDISV